MKNREAKEAGLEYVVGEFQIKQSSYRVVILGDETQKLPAARSGACAARGERVEVGRFCLDGQWCAILETPMNTPVQDDGNFSEILTEREMQITTLVSLGRSNKQIAAHLRISEWTVSTHLRRIFAKLGVKNRAAMVFRCAGAGAHKTAK